MEPGDTKPDENAWSGLDYWMSRVLRECDRAREDFAPEPVHDLRVALRRCRSIANGFMVFDPHPAWKLMKGEGRQLFQQLGALRDTQVMMEWVQRIAPSSDETSTILNYFLADQETQHKESASQALRDFNRKKWASWTRLLSHRAQRIPEGSMAFQHLALERWSDAHRLHIQAMRNRSHAAYHRLRIGLKQFRYTIENFLPERHAQWGSELGEYQDLLGEMHDLQVLWQTALAIKAFPSEEIRAEWRLRISTENESAAREIPADDAGNGIALADLANRSATAGSAGNARLGPIARVGGIQRFELCPLGACGKALAANLRWAGSPGIDPGHPTGECALPA